MLGYIYAFLYSNIWFPLVDESGFPINFTIGADTLDLAEWLSVISCVVIGSLIIAAMVLLIIKVFKWFFGLIGR